MNSSASRVKMHPHIIEDMEAIPEWIKFLPTVMMAVGAYVSYIFYIRRPYIPVELARAAAGCSTSSCSTNGISTNCTT